MMVSFVSSAEGLEVLVGLAERVIKPSVRLPSWPFTTMSGVVDVCEFEPSTSADFETVLMSLTQLHGDSSVSFLAIEKESRYFIKHYNFFPGFTLSVDSIPQGYWAALNHAPGGNEAESLLVRSEVITIFGSSGKWAVWAQRDWDMAVIFSESGPMVWRDRGITFLAPADAVEAWARPNFRLRPLTDRKVEEFVEVFNPVLRENETI